MKKFKTLINLFFTMFKIGLFTFGGGYAMIAVIQREIVENKKWIEQEEFLDLIAVAESTPGPLAINSATFLGYKISKIWGSIFATLGVVLPSFIIIYIISLFFDQFLQLEIVGYAFRGIQACVAFLIFSAGIKMFKSLNKSAFNLIIFCATVVALTLLDFFAVDFSSVFFILIGAVVGLIAYFISIIKSRANPSKKDEGGNE